MNEQQAVETYLFFLIEAVKEDNSGFFISCLAQNQGIDESKNSILERLGEEVIDCYIAEMDIVHANEIDLSDFESEPQNNILLGTERFSFKSKDGYLFICPNGIAKSASYSENEEYLTTTYAQIEDDYAPYTLEIIPDLFSIDKVIHIIAENSLKEMDFLGVYLDDFYDNQRAGDHAIWVHFDSKNKLLDFIEDTRHKILENGFLALEFGNKYTNNRVRITKTKEVFFWTENEIEIFKIQSELNSIGFTKVETNLSIRNNFNYVPYRMSNSLNREELINFFEEKGFEKHII